MDLNQASVMTNFTYRGDNPQKDYYWVVKILHGVIEDFQQPNIKNVV